MIHFQCVACGARMHAPDRLAGKRAKCLCCETITPIPESSSPEEEAPASEPITPVLEKDYERDPPPPRERAEPELPRPQRRKPRFRRRSSGNRAHVLLLAVGIVAVLVVLGVLGFLAYSWMSSSQSSTWTSDPKLADKLDKEVAVNNYKVRPPRDFEAIRLPREGRLPRGYEYQQFAWVGPERPDDTVPVLIISFLTAKRPRKLGTLRNEFDEVIRATQDEILNLRHTEPERGKINGLTCLRTRYEGIDEDGLKEHGWIYLILEGQTAILIEAADTEPHHAETLKVLEAAALTLRKK